MTRWHRGSLAIMFLGVAIFATSGRTEEVAATSKSEKLATLCKVWGFLKYYHPGLAKGEIDWDAALVKSIESVNKSTDRDSFNAELLRLIQNAGSLPDPKPWLEETTAEQRINFNLDWLADSSLFTDDVVARLTAVRDAPRFGPYRWVTSALLVGNTVYENEKPYDAMSLPDEAHRLLALFRYWNVIEYFFPYKYTIGRDWNDVLVEFIPRFVAANDELEYHLTVLELTTRIHDAHAGADSPTLYKHFGALFLPVRLQYIDGETVVSHVTDSLLRSDELRKGDVLLKIDDRDVSDLRKELWRFATASNDVGRHESINWRLVAGKRSPSTLVFQRGEQSLKVKVNRHDYETIRNANLKQAGPPWSVIEEDIGYVDMAVFKKEHIHDAMKAMSGKRGIIFDLRCYPEFILYDLMPCLSAKANPFAKFTQPDISRPGIFTMTQPIEVGPKQGLLSIFIGTPNPYLGKIVILVNETTVSRAEFVTMALQTAPHATVIGSQTAGADGNVSQLVLPGGIRTSFSGLGVFYPDGRETQHVGIVPDIKARPTVMGLQREEDEVLARAIRLLTEGE